MKKIAYLKPFKNFVNSIQIENPNLAHIICKLIPNQCPFEREIRVFDRLLFYIPPLCKLNPLYDEVVGLRFRALCFLADNCNENISKYC